MTDTLQATRSILVEEEFPHAPEVVWRVLTSGDLMAKWMMPPTGFAAVVGQDFSFQTRAAGAWDGAIRCRVLEVRPGERLSYSWSGGDASNQGYGSLLQTTVTFTLIATATGTRLRLEHAGFELPRNEVAYQNMSGGWTTVLARLNAAAEQAAQHD